MIGIFDSGLGGLFAADELRRRLPQADILYYADEAHLPYGEKSESFLLARGRAIAEGLSSLGARDLFAACGTLGSVALPTLQREYPLHGILDPLSRKTARAARGGAILLLATEATVRAGLLSAKIASFATHAPIYTQPCPSFVPLVEGWRRVGEEDVFACLRRSLAPYLRLPIAAIALGCTHFSPLAPYLARLFPAASIVDGAREGARAVAASLWPLYGAATPVENCLTEPPSRGGRQATPDGGSFTRQTPSVTPAARHLPREGGTKSAHLQPSHTPTLRILTGGDPSDLRRRLDPCLFPHLSFSTIEHAVF